MPSTLTPWLTWMSKVSYSCCVVQRFLSCLLFGTDSNLSLCPPPPSPPPELPVSIVKPLQDKTAVEKSRVMLDCTVSNPRCSIRWYKGSTVILPSERFEICSEGCYRKLNIGQVALSDAGTYSVQVGEYTCSANLTVEGRRQSTIEVLHQLLRHLKCCCTAGYVIRFGGPCKYTCKVRYCMLLPDPEGIGTITGI